MKRARIMLASVAIVAVVAGASAFTAKQKFGSTIYKAPAAGQLATITVNGFTLNENESQTRQEDLFTTQFGAVVDETTIAYSQL